MCSVVVVLGGLLVQLYFGGSLPRSPYPDQQARRAAARQRRVAPEALPPSVPHMMMQQPGGLQGYTPSPGYPPGYPQGSMAAPLR